ncbi:MAG: triose-phosphate isomerase [Spirochaetales bacterium]
MRTPYLAGNWKMHKTVRESTELARTLAESLGKSTNKIMVAPPFTSLAATVASVKGSSIKVGAQNMAQERQGAHTGEISPLMLKDVGVEVVILGHSERRHTYGESDELINRKVLLAIEEDLEVVLCVGETIDEREAGKVEDIVGHQLKAGLSSVPEDKLPLITIAYEPVWAIGTGKTATPKDANDVHAFIRSWIKNTYSEGAADGMIIQYGGSVKPNNVKELMSMEHIDGALVGGASLEVESFLPIATFNQ